MNVQNVQNGQNIDHSAPPFKAVNLPIQHHKIHQNVQLNKQRKMHPLRPPEHSQQPNQQHSKQYVEFTSTDPEAVDMENAQGL